MDYKLRVDVHKWKKDDVVSELELLSEGVDISKWLNEELIIKPVVKIAGDLNNDGVVDSKDSKIANDTLNIFKKAKNKIGGK